MVFMTNKHCIFPLLHYTNLKSNYLFNFRCWQHLILLVYQSEQRTIILSLSWPLICVIFSTQITWKWFIDTFLQRIQINISLNWSLIVVHICAIIFSKLFIRKPLMSHLLKRYVGWLSSITLYYILYWNCSSSSQLSI